MSTALVRTGLSEDLYSSPPRLLEYLQAMRDYFLLEAGDTMYDFYTAIFDKVQEKENWQQPSFLNVQLQEAVGQSRPEDSSRYCKFKTSRLPAVFLSEGFWGAPYSLFCIAGCPFHSCFLQIIDFSGNG